MSTTNKQDAPSATIKAYEDKIVSQLQQARSKLQQLEAQAKDKRAQAEVATISSLKTAQQNIDRKLQDLKKTHDTHVTQAKADIDADIATFKASIDQLTERVRTARK
jgi:hypothetical protein